MIDLEKYIRSHRSDLDNIEELNVDEMWGEFNHQHLTKAKRNYKFYLAAAIGILLLGVASIMVQSEALDPDEVISKKLTQVHPGLADEQVGLVKLIKGQHEVIERMGIDRSKFPELFQQLEVLDSLQLEAMNDLGNYQDRSNLYKTILRNYKSKARVLELMIYEFDKQENEIKYESSKRI